MIVIFISFYNYSNHLIECLKSINSQNFKDFEVVMLNDGSNQYEIENLKKWINANNKFRYQLISFEKNRGVGFAKYYGLNLINNRYNDNDIILVIDGDDKLVNNEIFHNLYHLYRNNPSIMWTIGGSEDKLGNKFTYEKYDTNKLNKRKFFIEHLRSFRKKTLNNYIFSNFYMPNNGFIIKTSDKIMMWPIIKRNAENGVRIKQKIYDYIQTKSSLSNVKNIRKNDSEKYKKILQSRNHFLSNIIDSKRTKERDLINNLRNKKIIVIGNRPLDKNLSHKINNYDIVIRFNNSYPGNQCKNSGNKISYLFINNGLTKFVLGRKFSKAKLMNENSLKNFKNWVNENRSKIVTRYYYNNNNDYNLINKNFIGLNNIYNTSENDKLLIFGILDMYKLDFNKKIIDDKIRDNVHFTMGFMTILWLLSKKLKFDICGFSKDRDIDYKIVNSNIWKKMNKSFDNKSLKSHNIELEKILKKYLHRNKLFNIIDE